MIKITPQYLDWQGLPQNFPERFWAKVHKTESCWIWTASLAKGYGQIRTGGERSRMIKAHRAAWILCRGPIPTRLWVLHKCDNPICVNPDHLFTGTGLDNVRDCISKYRRKPTCTYREQRWNHKLTEESAKIIREAFASGMYSQRELARMFHVSHTTVRYCVLGRTWVIPSKGCLP